MSDSVRQVAAQRLEPQRSASHPVGNYTYTAIILHWVMAALIFVMLGLGWYMVDLPTGPERSQVFALHKSIGLTIALLLLVRFAWWATHPRPPFPGSVPGWQARLARANFLVLYVLMVMQPLSGYLSSSFSGYKTNYFGIPLPHWGWKDPVLNELLTGVHVVCSRFLVVFIVMHLLGASAHLFLRRDGVFRRMWL